MNDNQGLLIVSGIAIVGLLIMLAYYSTPPAPSVFSDCYCVNTGMDGYIKQDGQEWCYVDTPSKTNTSTEQVREYIAAKALVNQTGLFALCGYL